jgi:hypothetical protein
MIEESVLNLGYALKENLLTYKFVPKFILDRGTVQFSIWLYSRLTSVVFFDDQFKKFVLVWVQISIRRKYAFINELMVCK